MTRVTSHRSATPAHITDHWFGNVKQPNKNNLQHIINISSKVTGVTQSSLIALYEKQVVNSPSDSS